MLRTGSFEPAKKTKTNNNNANKEEKSPQEEALARYNTVKVLNFFFKLIFITIFISLTIK